MTGGDWGGAGRGGGLAIHLEKLITDEPMSEMKQSRSSPVNVTTLPGTRLT